ncbi:MAG: transcriptional regulator [Candidatus Aenigmarchaeota archaeon ex4484_56]|nr:MAG: transcriptional regulator [Candidatus Aenigmarchaeota archaeon ex4484_56]
MDVATEFKKRIAGEIVLSKNAGETIKKWRKIFKITQTELANKINTGPSVISDYECGRRKTPGITLIEKIVNALIEIDLQNGGKIINEFVALYKIPSSDYIILADEFKKPIKIKKFLHNIYGEPCYHLKDELLYGFSLIDSEKAAINISSIELSRYISLISEHCLIFTNLQRGRSPLIAMKIANIKPGLVVLHGIDKVDEIALRIAKLENIPLAISYVSSIENLIEKLKNITA